MEDDSSDFQTFSSQAGASVFWFFHYPAGLAICHGGKHPEPGLTIHADGDFVLLPPSRYSSGIVHDYLNPEQPVAEAPQWLVDLAFETVQENSVQSVPRIPPHRADYEVLSGFAKPSAKVENHNFGRKGWLVFGRMGWRRKINFPRRA
jgi:hypothetical protein